MQTYSTRILSPIQRAVTLLILRAIAAAVVVVTLRTVCGPIIPAGYALLAWIVAALILSGRAVAEIDRGEVSQSVIDDYRVKHSGDILWQISAAVDSMRSQVPLIGSRIEQFQNVRLEQPERVAFARAALVAKYPEESPITPDQILTARRAEDREPTLWNTLNTVQESLLSGGQRYDLRNENGRRTQRRTTGAVKSVDGNATINRAVWQLAEEMAKLKA